MASSKRLIDLHLSGESAKHLIDALVEELPSSSVIKQTILCDLPSGTKVIVEEGTVYIHCEDKQALTEKMHFFELMYPELDFVSTYVGGKK